VSMVGSDTSQVQADTGVRTGEKCTESQYSSLKATANSDISKKSRSLKSQGRQGTLGSLFEED
jgi:hypothetical protein